MQSEQGNEDDGCPGCSSDASRGRICWSRMHHVEYDTQDVHEEYWKEADLIFIHSFNCGRNKIFLQVMCYWFLLKHVDTSWEVLLSNFFPQFEWAEYSKEKGDKSPY